MWSFIILTRNTWAKIMKGWSVRSSSSVGRLESLLGFWISLTYHIRFLPVSTDHPPGELSPAD